jgi:hypothetical protein
MIKQSDAPTAAIKERADAKFNTVMATTIEEKR